MKSTSHASTATHHKQESVAVQHAAQAHAQAEHTEEAFEYRPYKFEIQGEASAHNQHADAEGNVFGEYSYTNELGHVIRVEYKAGPSIGFVIVNQEELDQSVHKATLEAAAAHVPKTKTVETTGHVATASAVHTVEQAPVQTAYHLDRTHGLLRLSCSYTYS